MVRRYLLAGLLACGVCGRRMESAWSNGKPAYRCRTAHERTAPQAPPGRAARCRCQQPVPPLRFVGRVPHVALLPPGDLVHEVPPPLVRRGAAGAQIQGRTHASQPKTPGTQRRRRRGGTPGTEPGTVNSDRSQATAKRLRPLRDLPIMTGLTAARCGRCAVGCGQRRPYTAVVLAATAICLQLAERAAAGEPEGSPNQARYRHCTGSVATSGPGQSTKEGANRGDDRSARRAWRPGR